MSALTKKLRELKDYREFTGVTSRDDIIKEYAPLIKFVALKMASRLPPNIEVDDLISCGVIGLMDAMEKFDPKRDNKFKTYAEFRIRGAILDELRAQDWVPRSVREKSKQLEKAYTELESKLGRMASDEEMSAHLKISLEEFHDLLNRVKSVSLLNIDEQETFNKNDKKLLNTAVTSDQTDNPFFLVYGGDAKEKLKEAILSLPEKHRLVLSLYYYEDLNLKEIGKILNVTESRISQIHTQAIVKLKSKIKKTLEIND